MKRIHVIHRRKRKRRLSAVTLIPKHDPQK
jgi:hypothetical protein